jgi:hypothetical protein
MTLKALTPLLDPVSGHIKSPLAMLRDRRKEWAKKRRAPTEAFISVPFSLHTNLTPHFDPKQDQGVELALWGPFKHWSAPQNTKVCKFQPNPSEGDFLYIKADILYLYAHVRLKTDLCCNSKWTMNKDGLDVKLVYHYELTLSKQGRDSVAKGPLFLTVISSFYVQVHITLFIPMSIA